MQGVQLPEWEGEKGESFNPQISLPPKLCNTTRKQEVNKQTYLAGITFYWATTSIGTINKST